MTCYDSAVIFLTCCLPHDIGNFSGGVTSSFVPTSSTYMYDTGSKVWTTGTSSMAQRRFYHACGKIQDQGDGTVYIVVAAGSDLSANFQSERLTSTELYNTATGEWISGPDLPVALEAAAMAPR